MSTSTVILCGPKVYSFEGWTFEDASMMAGPWPLKKNGELREKAGRQFWQMWKRFDALPKAAKEKYRVSGGCQVLRMKGVVANAK